MFREQEAHCRDKRKNAYFCGLHLNVTLAIWTDLKIWKSKTLEALNI